MKEVAWLAEVPLAGYRNPSQSHFSCVIAVPPWSGPPSTGSGRDGDRERGGCRRSTQTRVPAPGMDSLSPTAASCASCSGELQNVQSVSKPTHGVREDYRALSCFWLLDLSD